MKNVKIKDLLNIYDLEIEKIVVINKNYICLKEIKCKILVKFMIY